MPPKKETASATETKTDTESKTVVAKTIPKPIIKKKASAPVIKSSKDEDTTEREATKGDDVVIIDSKSTTEPKEPKEPKEEPKEPTEPKEPKEPNEPKEEPKKKSVIKPILKISKKKSTSEARTARIADDQINESTVKPSRDKDSDPQESKQEVLLDVSKAIKSGKKPSRKQESLEHQNLFSEDDIDYRSIMMNYDFSKNKTLPKITKYEKALLVGKRAKQIEEGANPNVKVLPGQNAIEIAEEELRQRKIPFIIKRPIGNKFEYWKPADMEVIMD